MRCIAALIIALTALTTPACLATSPEDEARAALGGEGRGGDDDDEGDEFHRPGQPCLVCHRDGYSPGDKQFVVAGTIYLRASDTAGVEGASVTMTDAVGHQFTAITNRVGSFMVQVKSDLGAPEQRGEGKLRIPWQPVFPLEISISRGDLEQEMTSYAWRDGSCAACHTGSQDALDSVAKVWLIEEAP